MISAYKCITGISIYSAIQQVKTDYQYEKTADEERFNNLKKKQVKLRRFERRPFVGNRPIAHDVTAPVHLEDKLAIYA